jgi:hypothetical protein
LLYELALPDEPANLGLGDGVLEYIGRSNRGDVEQGAGWISGRDAVKLAGVAAVEGDRAVKPDPGDPAGLAVPDRDVDRDGFGWAREESPELTRTSVANDRAMAARKDRADLTRSLSRQGVAQEVDAAKQRMQASRADAPLDRFAVKARGEELTVGRQPHAASRRARRSRDPRSQLPLRAFRNANPLILVA